MGLIVQKFGGTSVASAERIVEVSKIIEGELKNNNKVIVVVSAMAGVTSGLITLCAELSSLNSDMNLIEYDAALCSGETVTASLLALTLQEIGIKARSVFAWQLPILTNASHSNAVVEMLNVTLIKECLYQNIIPIIAGFQGITKDNRLSTLGRGGSDTTASIVAASMEADRCDIYTDVAGVFTADPRIIHNAKKINKISFEEMFELATSGAKVLHSRCVELAMKYNINMRVLSSFSSEGGTLITSKDQIMENRIITGITSNKNLLKLTVESNSTLSFNDVCSLLSRNNIHIELMLNVDLDKKYNFIIHLSDRSRLEILMSNLKKDSRIIDFSIDTAISIVTVVGFGIKNDPELIGNVIDQLALESIEISIIQISGIKISILMSDKDIEKTIRILHNFFELDKL